LLQDRNPPGWFENPPEPQLYCCRYRWDRETDEEIATMRISGGEDVDARGASNGEALKSLLQKLREMGLDVDRMDELDMLRSEVTRYEASLVRFPGWTAAATFVRL